MFRSRTNHTNQKRNSGGAINPLIVVALGAAALTAIGVVPRVENHIELSRLHEELKHTVPIVKAVLVKPATKTETLSLPGDLQPIQNMPIYARANGYLLKRFVDIGDNVKAGQLLALIDTPELDQQVEQAAAGLRQAQRRDHRARAL